MPRPPQSLILALDIGSSSLRTALFTDGGTRILQSSASRQYALGYTNAGGAELRPSSLLQAARGCLNETLQARKNSLTLRRLPIVAVSGSAIWHSLLGLDGKGRPLTPIFTWADSRSTADAVELRQQISERKIQLRTGCMLRAPYWPAKLRWLRRTNRSLFTRVSSWVSPAAWIFAQLFHAETTSHSMASGTGLYNLQNGAWDAELCDLCDVRVEQLGPLRDQSLAMGRTAGELKKAAIFTALGDGAAGTLGSGAEGNGRIAINIGTSAAVRMVQPKRARNTPRLPPGIFKHVLDEGRFVLGGAVSNGGNLRQWCLRELRAGDEREAENALVRKAAAADTMTVLPYWIPERAPTWPEALRGTITGLTPATTASDILRATTTGVFYRLAEILEQLQPNRRVSEVIVSGGVHSPATLEILADCLGRNLRVCPELESSLRGAAVHALESLATPCQRCARGE